MSDFRDRRRQLIEALRAQGIHDVRVLAAMARVPRHLFVPEHLRAHAYENRPLPIGSGQTISQPLIVAMMLEALELDGHERVLDVGTGSGYQAALLALLAREVDTIEILPELARSAGRLLFELGLRNVRTIAGDGSKGWPSGAPYDAIIVAAAAPAVPRALVAQLAEGGHLILPVGEDRDQRLVLAEKKNGTVTAQDLGPCIFVPLVPGDQLVTALE